MKKKIILIVSTLIPVLAVVALGFTIYSLSNTVEELRTEISQSRADAILASADVNSDTVVSVPILYYDQTMDECVNIYDLNSQDAIKARQFEWTACDYYVRGIETGLVDAVLDEQYLPVALGGNMLSNRGVSGDSFKRWFNAVDGKSKSYAGTLELKFDSANASFGYKNDEFYPLNSIAIPDEAVNKDGDNHLFTANLGVPIQVLADGHEEFTVTADDDTWVFIGDKLVLDMGGVHGATTGHFVIMNNGEVYTEVEGEGLAYSGVTLTKDTGTIVRVFHADRNSDNSVFDVNFTKMLLNITTDASLAKSGGVEVAYDPENPSYVAPLGETLTVRPDRSQSVLAAAIAQTVILGSVMIVLVLSISVAWRYSHRVHNQE